MTSDQAGMEGRAHLYALREALTMSLYLSIVLLALLVGFGGESDIEAELALIWGTAIGLGLAHIFAFRLTATFASGRERDAEDNWAILGIGVAIVGTALIASIPYLIWGDTVNASFVATLLLGGLIGATAMGSARHAGAGWARSLILTVFVLVVAAIVVAVKFTLTH